jgi:hypothetical protein
VPLLDMVTTIARRKEGQETQDKGGAEATTRRRKVRPGSFRGFCVSVAECGRCASWGDAVKGRKNGSVCLVRVGVEPRVMMYGLGCSAAGDAGGRCEVSGGKAVVQEGVESRGREGRSSKKPVLCHGRTKRCADVLADYPRL